MNNRAEDDIPLPDSDSLFHHVHGTGRPFPVSFGIENPMFSMSGTLE